jgi:hypothetical protein
MYRRNCMMRHLGFWAEAELRHPFISGSCQGQDDVDERDIEEEDIDGEAVGGEVGGFGSFEIAQYGGGDSMMAEVFRCSLRDGNECSSSS